MTETQPPPVPQAPSAGAVDAPSLTPGAQPVPAGPDEERAGSATSPAIEAEAEEGPLDAVLHGLSATVEAFTDVVAGGAHAVTDLIESIIEL